jgi:hypothetical protein
MKEQAMPLRALPRKKSGKITVFPVLAGMAVGVLCGWSIGLLTKAHGRSHLSPWTIIVLPVVLLLVLALHEAGHVTAGLIGGFEFRLFIAGPLRLERRNGRFKISFNRIPAHWGGLAACVPKSYEANLHRKMMLFVAGGPLFSLLGAVFMIPGFSLLTSHLHPGLLLITFGLTSAALALVTLLPLPAGGFKTDGTRLAMLLRRRPEGERWTALAALGGLAHTARPREWPVELMTGLGDGLDAQADAAMACLVWHIWHADKREWESAQLWLERALSHAGDMPASMLPILYLAAADYYARHGADKLLARQYFDLAQRPGLHDPDDMYAVRAAVLIAEGRAAEALLDIDLAEQKLRFKPPAMAQCRREDLDELRAQLKLQ